MFYYLVDKIGDGTKLNTAFRANYVGPYVWSDKGYNGKYVIALPIETAELTPINDLENECNLRGLLIDDVLTWFVGD